MLVVVKLALVLCDVQFPASTSPAQNGFCENCVCLLLCRDKTNGLSAAKQLCHLLTRWSWGDIALTPSGSRLQFVGDRGCSGRCHREPPSPVLGAEALACSSYCPSKRDPLACLLDWDTSLPQLFPQISSGHSGQFLSSSSHMRRGCPAEQGPRQRCLLEPPQSLHRAYPKPLAQIATVSAQESQIRYTGSMAIFKRICVCKWIQSHLEMSPLWTWGGVGPKPQQTHKDPQIHVPLCLSCSPHCKYCAYTLPLLRTWDFVLICNTFLSKDKHNKQVSDVLEMLGNSLCSR